MIDFDYSSASPAERELYDACPRLIPQIEALDRYGYRLRGYAPNATMIDVRDQGLTNGKRLYRRDYARLEKAGMLP